MTVYIDDMYRYEMGRFQGKRMSHMIADSEEELHAFAAGLGLKRTWFQGDHYDVAKSKRALAIKSGAVAIPLKTLATMAGNARAQWPMGTPETAQAIATLRRTRCDDAVTSLEAVLPSPEASDALATVHRVSKHLLSRIAGRVPAPNVTFETGAIHLLWLAHGVRLHVEIRPASSDKTEMRAAVCDSWGVLDDWRGQNEAMERISRAQITMAARHRTDFLRMVEDHIAVDAEPRQPAFL